MPGTAGRATRGDVSIMATVAERHDFPRCSRFRNPRYGRESIVNANCIRDASPSAIIEAVRQSRPLGGWVVKDSD